MMSSLSTPPGAPLCSGHDPAESRQLLAQLADLCAGLDEPARIELLEKLLGENACRRLGIYALPPQFRLSVVIPVYNEVDTVAEVVARVRACGVPCEIILVDDASTDGTRDLLESWQGQPDLKLAVSRPEPGQGRGPDDRLS